MIAIFKTEDPEEIKRISKVNDLCSFIWRYEQELRLYARGKKELPETPGKLANDLYDKWFNMLHDDNIILEDIWG